MLVRQLDDLHVRAHRAAGDDRLTGVIITSGSAMRTGPCTEIDASCSPARQYGSLVDSTLKPAGQAAMKALVSMTQNGWSGPGSTSTTPGTECASAGSRSAFAGPAAPRFVTTTASGAASDRSNLYGQYGVSTMP
ncbi:hypothetical protein ACFQZ4_37390 [Catellatospora coxensis]